MLSAMGDFGRFNELEAGRRSITIAIGAYFETGDRFVPNFDFREDLAVVGR